VSKALRQIDYQRMIRALKAEGVVDNRTPVVGVHGIAFLPVGQNEPPADFDLMAEREAWRRKHGYD
jgi:hypothetical protein